MCCSIRRQIPQHWPALSSRLSLILSFALNIIKIPLNYHANGPLGILTTGNLSLRSSLHQRAGILLRESVAAKENCQVSRRSLKALTKNRVGGHLVFVVRTVEFGGLEKHLIDLVAQLDE